MLRCSVLAVHGCAHDYAVPNDDAQRLLSNDDITHHLICAVIIGKGGANIKEIRRRHNVRNACINR
jgi:hypothetical protein